PHEASGIFLDADSVSSISKHLAWSRCAKPLLPQSLEGSSCSRHIFCSKRADSPKAAMNPRDAQRADKKERAGRKRKERPLMGKECVIFPEGGLCSYDIQPLY